MGVLPLPIGGLKMKRMHTDEEIKSLTEVSPEMLKEAIADVDEGTIASLLGVDADGDAVKAGITATLNGKYVRVANLSDIGNFSALTEAEINLFKEGVFFNGSHATYGKNPVFFPARNDGYYNYQGMAIISPTNAPTDTYIATYSIHNNALTIEALQNPPIVIYNAQGGGGAPQVKIPSLDLSDYFRILGKRFPTYPSTGLQSILCWDATQMTWKEWKDILKNYVAPEYDETTTYDVGDLVLYGAALYQCSTGIATAEAWNPTHWTSTTLAAVIKALHP